MSDKTAIQWTDATWNPTTGCTKVSPGCANCYIERTPAFRIHHRKFVNGATDLRLHADRLDQPLHWRKPRRVFVNSLSDLFHKDVPEEFISDVFGVMALAKQHTFQVLTKRPDRMLEWMRDHINRDGKLIQYIRPANGDWKAVASFPMPLPNVWLGVSVENQHFADERIPLLLQTPAAVRFISAEPLLEAVDIRFGKGWQALPAPGPHAPPKFQNRLPGYLHWVIVGGESGPKSRPFDLAWARSLVAQCKASAVPCFVKQFGAEPFSTDVLCTFDSYEQWVNKARSWLGGVSGGGLKYTAPERAVCVDSLGRVCAIGRDFMRARDEEAFPVIARPLVTLRDKKGGDIAEWPDDLRVREFPQVMA